MKNMMILKFRTYKVTAIMLGAANRVLKSTLFNVLVFFLGFSAGFLYTATTFHRAYVQNENYECISSLQEHLKQQRVLDKKIDAELDQLKARIVHEQCNYCKHAILNKVID